MFFGQHFHHNCLAACFRGRLILVKTGVCVPVEEQHVGKQVLWRDLQSGCSRRNQLFEPPRHQEHSLALRMEGIDKVSDFRRQHTRVLRDAFVHSRFGGLHQLQTSGKRFSVTHTPFHGGLGEVGHCVAYSQMIRQHINPFFCAHSAVDVETDRICSAPKLADLVRRLCRKGGEGPQQTAEWFCQSVTRLHHRTPCKAVECPAARKC
mmetsp:Transcript_10230/g.19345  ORF Transcript_10230/g.19345 Transcript_10230/m.19345 type:complete len:207 (-) Transcript_10230:68-688(-)